MGRVWRRWLRRTAWWRRGGRVEELVSVRKGEGGGSEDARQGGEEGE